MSRRNPPSSSVIAVLALALALLGSAPARAQKLDTELQFVRDLASKLRFISLAQSELDNLKLRFKGAGDAQAIDQLGIEISLIGAKLHPNREEKRTLYKDALDRCKRLLEAVSDGPVALAAQVTLADASLEFGRFLADELEIARLEEPDRVKDLETDAAAVFQAGEDACDAAMRQMKAKAGGGQPPIDYYVTWMRKGILLREHARAVGKDRDYLADRARTTLEELIFEMGEETALGQRALFEYAQVDEVLGNLRQAVQGYSDVISSANTVLTDETLELSGDVKELMVITLEEAYDRKAVVQLQLGSTDDVLATAEAYRKNLSDLTVPLTDLDDPANKKGNEDPRFGHSLYLTMAQAMAESGDQAQVAKAMKLIQFLNDEHPSDIVGLRAKVVLKNVLAVQSQQVSGPLLFEVAKGDYQAKNYEAAVQGFKRAIAAMTPQEASNMGLEAYWYMGNSLALQGRVLEAALLLKDGLERLATGAEPATQERAASLAQKAIRQVMANTASDSFFDPLSKSIDDLAAQFGSVADVEKRMWNESLRLISTREYEKAATALRQIQKGGRYFEWAQARLATVLSRRDDFAGARKVIADYRAYRETRDADIPGDRNDLKQARQIAEGEIAFTEAYLLYQEAMGDGPTKTKDPTKLPEVINLLSDFEPQHGRAVSEMVPRVHYMIARCYAEIGNLDMAEEKYRTLKQISARDPNIPILATVIFSTYDDQIRAKETEVDALDKQGDKAAVDKATEELKALRRKAMAIGLDYFESSDDPQYGIAYLTLEQAAKLRDWTRVESFGLKVTSTFEKTKYADKVDKYVRPIVGDALLRQGKIRQAYDMLVAAEKASPKNYPIKRLICLALGGWQEINERGGIDKNEGLGRFAEAYDKYWGEYKAYGLNESLGVKDYSIEWYRFYWECYNFARQAAATDSKYAEWAKTLYSKAESTDRFATLRGLSREGRELCDLFLDPSNAPPR